MVKNSRCIVLGAAAGALAVIGAWYALDTAAGEPLADWLGPWSYGLALGIGTGLVYELSGGRGPGGAIAASALGATVLPVTVLWLLMIEAVRDQRGELLLAAIYLVWWAAALAIVFLVLPATVATLAVFVVAAGLQRLAGGRWNDRRACHRIEP